MGTHRYLSWIRFGLSATRADGAADGSNPTVTARIELAGGSENITVTMHGPADVIGLSGSAIQRRDPAPASIGIAPNGMPFVELAPADLPWRFSPSAPGVQVMPWLRLIVVPATTPLAPRAPAPLPVLTTPIAELPDPADAWAWAHIQVEEPPTGITGDLATFVRDHSDLAIARLVAPRQLAPNTRYRACLVPVFEAGRRAGLAQDIAADVAMRFAWQSSDTSVELPVYDAWEFQTGEANDFESIARRLRARDARAMFAPLEIDVAAAIPRDETAIATTFGLLRPKQAQGSLPEATAIASTLRSWVSPPSATVVGPPLYGAGPTEQTSVPPAPHWMATLNLDPRLRVMAGGGADVVRSDQETLVADARDALGQIAQANTLVRGAQLAAALSDRLRTRHVASRRPERIVAMMWPSLETTPLAASTPASELLAPALRRIARPHGPLARGRVGGIAWSRVGRDIDPRVHPPTEAVNPIVTMQSVRAERPTFRVTHALPATRRLAIESGLAARIARAIETVRVRPVAPPDPAALANAALAAAAPLNIARRTFARLVGTSLPASLEQVRELRGEIDLSRPLVDRLVSLRPELFVPHLEALPPDSVTMLEADPVAVEALLVGANDELLRELIWRGVAIDRRATLLRQVWPRQTRDGRGHDAPPISQWSNPLGAHLTQALTVFVVRSELVRRFPNALYACVPALPDPVVGRRPSDNYVLPLFRGLATADTAYVGFGQPIDVLEAGHGSYFVIQERPGHTRFGLDATRSPGARAWVNLSWEEINASPYIPLGTTPADYPVTPRWNHSAANMAAIIERPAVRVAIHLRELEVV